MSSHYSEDDLTLYYYGDGRGAGRRDDVTRHLQTCSACATLYREIAETLAMVVAEDVPERTDQYGLEVWQRIRHRLPERGDSGFARFAGFTGFTRFADRLALIGAAAVLAGAAFVAGRMWREPARPDVARLASPTDVGGRGGQRAQGGGQRAEGATDSEAYRARILLTSVADHLDRSGRVLTEIMNTHAPSDISAEQRWAEDLVATSRLYRQDATDAGEQSVAAVLDDLERNLLEIVHSPSNISAAELEQIRRRLDAAALLFKVRVMSDELRQREAAPSSKPGNTSPSAPRTSTSAIS